jgi:hypothetical protein
MCKLAVENALIFRPVEDSATTDYLPGLPNAPSLSLRRDSKIARCERVMGVGAESPCGRAQ